MFLAITAVAATTLLISSRWMGRNSKRLAAVSAGLLLASTLTAITAVGNAPPAEAGPSISDPGWSNGKIAYSVSYSQAQWTIGTVEADGSDPGGVGGHWIASYKPSWSPTGHEVAYTFFNGTVGANSFGIGIRDAAGVGETTVLTTSDAPGKPTWSPDGRFLAFTMTSSAGTGLFTVKTDGTQLNEVFPTNTADPDWSPDGTKIALSRELSAGGGWQIVLVSPTGTSLATLTSSNGEFVGAHDPAWSRDGTKIAFTAKNASGDESIWVMNADGTGQTRMADDGVRPEWAPNGALILFVRGSLPFVVPSNGGAASVLPHWGEWIVFPRGYTGFDWQPVWDPATAKHRTGLVDPSTGKWHLYNEDGLLDTSFYYGNPGDYPFMGDWDCDGVETPGMYRQSDGYVYLRNSNTVGVADTKFFFGDPGDIPIAGDFNGDGCGTVSIYRPSNQTFYIINKLGENDGGLGAAEFSYVFGDPGDKPFVGDFNGDGEETVGLHRESTGLVYFRNSHTQGNADSQFIFGDPGDRLIAGDWNDDGMFSPTLFRPGNTTMYFRYTNSQGNADAQFVPNPNGAAWLPVAGTR